MAELKIVSEGTKASEKTLNAEREKKDGGLKKIYKILIGVTVLGALLRIVLINANKALAWDEAVYLSLAESISKGLGYGWVGAFNNAFRAPGLSSAIYAFNFLGDVELAGRVVILLASIGSIALAYVVGKDWFNQKVGILSAFIVATNVLHVFFSHRVLTENLFGFLILLNLFLFWRVINGEHKFLWGLALVTAFSAMVRYETSVVVFVLIVYTILFRRTEFNEIVKTRHFIGSVILGLAVISPWFFFSQKYFGNPIGAATHHVSGTVSGFVNPIVLPLMYPLAFGLLLPFLFYAIYRTLEYHGEKPLFLFFFLLATIFLIGLKNNVLRYTVPFIPLGAVFLSAAAVNLKNKWKMVFVLLCIGNLAAGYGAVYLFNQTEVEDHPIYGVLQGRDDNFREHLDAKAAGLKLAELTDENEVVLTDAYAFVHYWAKRPFVEVPEEEDLAKVISENDIRYIYTTQHIEQFSGFQTVFETPNVVIYEV